MPAPASAARKAKLPKVGGCAVFPRTSHWNRRVDKLPVLAGSDAIVGSIGAAEDVHADFGSGLYEGRPIGIPYRVVSRRQKRVPVSFEYASESDGKRYPIPRNAPIEGGPRGDGDRHVILIDRSRKASPTNTSVFTASARQESIARR